MDEINVEQKLIDIIKNMSRYQQRSLLSSIENRQEAYRNYPRLESSIPTDYTIEEKTYKDFIENISAGGVFISTDKSQYVGHDISLNFRLAGYDKPIKALGKILRSEPNGFAVEFYEKVEELLNMVTEA